MGCRRSLQIALAVVLGGIAGQAQAPVAPALLSAHTVYVAGNGVEARAVDELAKAVQSWPRLKLVAISSEADLTFSLSRRAAGSAVGVPVGGMVVAAQSREYEFTVVDRGGQVVYSDIEKIGLTTYGGIKNLVKRLRLRVEAANPGR